MKRWKPAAGVCCGCAAVLILMTGALATAALQLSATAVTAAEPARWVPPMTCAGLRTTQGFGTTPWEHPHAGIDIACPEGTAVVAVAAGIFHRRVWGFQPCAYPPGATGGLGLFGELDTRGFSVLYGHLEAFAALDGALVRAGETLGFEGTTGCSSGPHLHFQVDVAGRAVDPCALLPPGYPAAHTEGGLHCWGAAPPR